jgi:hypothetical protein
MAMRIRHLAVATTMVGALLGAAVGLGLADRSSPALAQTDRQPVRPGIDPSAPVTLPSPIDAQDEERRPADQDPMRSGQMDTDLTTSVDARALIGAELKSAEDESVGIVESVQVNRDGGVRSVIVSIATFLGLGQRSVALGWNTLNVTDDGQTVHAMLTKEELRALPEYEYPDGSLRGKLFDDRGALTN